MSEGGLDVFYHMFLSCVFPFGGERWGARCRCESEGCARVLRVPSASCNDGARSSPLSARPRTVLTGARTDRAGRSAKWTPGRQAPAATQDYGAARTQDVEIGAVTPTSNMRNVLKLKP